MIPAVQVIEIITEDFPNVNSVQILARLFHKFELIADHVIALLDNEEYKSAQQIFQLLDDLTTHVEPVIVIAIENVFIYRMGTKIVCDRNKQKLMQLLPERFKEIILRQFLASNI